VVRLGLLASLAAFASTACGQPARPLQGPPPAAVLAKAHWFQTGETVWIDAPDGKVKTRVYKSEKLDPHPVLLVMVHGDIPNPGQGLYEFAEAVARISDNVVAAGLLRPGYKDAQGDASAGKMGYAIGDNYTPQVVDDVDAAVRQLKARYHAGKVVVMGHSGGGAITANLIGRHPGDVDAALLLACGCDPNEFMTRFVGEHPRLPMVKPNLSLLPLDLAAKVSPRTHVRMVIGDKDDVVRLPASQAYADALKARGVDVKLTIAPGVGHNDVFAAPQTRDALAEVLALEGAKLLSPDPSLVSAVRF
jgi:dienelactone hydrolase